MSNADNTDTITGEATVSAINEIDTKGLSATERCDRCGAQAHLEVVLPVSTLLFCAHHGAQNYDALVMVPGAVINDYRPYLVAQEAALVHPAVKS